MALLERIADRLGGMNGEIVRCKCSAITEIRMRVGRSLQIDLLEGGRIEGEILERQVFQSILNHLMDNSLYSRENELRQGYFTTSEGFRVGVCGKVNAGKGGIEQLSNIGSACIRVPREALGCAAGIVETARKSRLYSMLIVSPPALGKTTLLRDYIRTLSDGGMNVGLADERREIACCMEGIPQLDVGARTDVMDGCPKELALNMMIRACAPDLVAADEIGSGGDAQALMDARRSGVQVAASAHGLNLKDVAARPAIHALLKEGIFDWCILLGPGRGQVRQIISLHEDADEGLNDVQGHTVGADIACLYMHGANALQCVQAKV